VIYEQAADILNHQIFVKLGDFAPGFDTYLKLEGLNPAGSIKLKTARGLMDAAEQSGIIGPGSLLIESTSGNLGVALAALAAARGYRITLVTDPNTNPHSAMHMKALGAEVVVVQERDANGGFLHTRIDYIQRQIARTPGLHWLNQYANPANVQAHRLGTADEILTSFGVPDWLFVGVGTAGTLMGCLERFATVGASTTIVGVDAEGSVTFGGPAGARQIPGLGTSRRPEIFQDTGQFRKMMVAETETIRACRRVAREHGLLVGGSTGTVLAALLAARDEIPAGSRVLVISPDMGDRYLETVYDDDWVISRYGADALEPAGPDLVALAELAARS
jgi:cysteine synthase A